MTTTLLSVSWSVSRGRDTYGYNICRLDDTTTGKRYRCMGGGYDMVGTVFAEWLEGVHQERLQKIRNQAFYYNGFERNEKGLYGMRRRDDGTVSLDGGCGIDSMRRIAKACGLTVEWRGDRKGNTVAFIVTEEA